MASAPILPFAVWQSGTNQNSIPANDNALRAEILAGLVISKTTTAQPASPADGDIYIIPAGATGAQWSPLDADDLAIFKGGSWYAFVPVPGVVVNFEGSQEQYDEGSAGWVELSGGGAGGAWGSISGTLSAQTDLQSALDAKASITYVDALVQGLSWKKSVRAATTTNGTLATAFENGDSIDGVTLATGDRILLKNQTAASENGIYTVNASGAPTRATDADTGAELVNATVYVSEGTTLGDTQWTQTVNAPITVGSTALVFAQLSAGSIAWGAITGSLSSQTDLVAALALKQDRSPAIQSVTSSATVTPTFSNDLVKITAQAAGLTLANPTGTAIDGLGMVIRIKDNGTARSIAFGSQYRAIGVTLPSTTVISKTLYVAMIYNADDTKWDVLAVGQES